MSPRWSSYVAPKPPCPPKGGSKTQNGRFPSKIALRLKKVCYKVSLCKKCQRQYCKAFIGLTNRAKMIGGDDRFCLKFLIKQSFAPSGSAVTPDETSSINTARKSTTRAFQWAQDEHCTLSPKGAQKRKTAVFPLKSHFPWIRFATKFLCVKTVSDKLVGHSLA